jgi:response regulator RpfG family c-di-GMP phosphodiesterase
VDVWDSLLAQRPFRKPWTEDEAIKHLQQNIGSHFDPNAVQNFLHMLEESGGYHPNLAS